MADVIAEGVVRVGVDDNTTAELARIEAEYRSTMAKIGREEATVRIKGNIEDFKSKVDEAKARLSELDKEIKAEEARNSGLSAQQKAASTRRLNDLRAEKQALSDVTAQDEKQLRTLNEHYNSVVRYNKEAQLGEQRRAAAARKEQEDARVRAQSDAAAIRAQRDLTSARQSDEAAQRRILALNQQYNRQAENVRNLNQQLSSTTGVTHQIVEVNRDKALADMKDTRSKLAELGRKPIVEHLDLDTSAARKAWNLWTQGTASGRDQFTSFSDLVKKFFGARLNIGPITASIGGFAAALGTLAPVILGLIGAFGSLVSVMGAGLLGAIGVAGAGMSGFGLATLGVATAFHPLLAQMKIAQGATQNYNKQVELYGKNSTQAKKAQQEMNNSLAALPKPVQDAARGVASLNEQFHKLTMPTALQSFSTITRSAMRTASADMGFFARDTNNAMRAASQGFASWMAALRSAPARQILDNIFSNFNKSIPGLMSGISSLAAVMGRWFSTMSNFLPGLSQDFARWAANLDETAKRTHGWADAAPRLIQAMKDIISFGGAAGRVLVAFFKAGIEPGSGWVESMTRGLNKLADSMNTVAGQHKLNNFFGQSISVTKELFRALEPLFAVFVHLAALFTPVANAMLPIIAFFTRLTSGIISALGPLGKIIVDVGAFIAVGRILGKLSLFGGIITEAKAAFAAIKAVREAGLGIAGIRAGISAFKDTKGGATEGAAAGTEIGARMEAAGAAVGAEIGGSIESAGAAAGATMAGEITAATAGGVAVTDAGAVGAAGAAAGNEVAGSLTAAGGAAAGEMEGAFTGGGAQAASEIAGAMATGGLDAAAEIRAAFATGGAASAAEQRAAGAASAATRGVAADTGAGAAAAGAGKVAQAETAAGSAGLAASTGARALIGSFASMATVAITVVGPVLGVVGAIRAIINYGKESGQVLAGVSKSGQMLKNSFVTMNNSAVDNYHSQQQLVTVGQQLRSTHGQISSTQATLNKLSDHGKQNTQEYKDALARLNGELDQQHSLEVQQDQLQQKRIADSKVEITTGQQNLKRAQSEIDLAKADIRLSGENAKNRAALTQALKDQYNAQNQVVLGQFNMQRAQAGLFPLVGKNADETAKYASQLRSLMDLTKGSPKAQSFLVHLPDPRDITKIQSAIAGLTSQKDITKTVQILANSKNAEDAINKIDGLQVKEKTVHINTQVGDTIARIAKVEGIKLTAKEQKILHSGDPEAIAALIKLKGIKVDPKIMKIFGDMQDAIHKHDNVRALKDVNKLLRILGNDGSAKRVHGFWASVADINKNWNLHGQDGSTKAKHGYWANIADINKNWNLHGQDGSTSAKHGYWATIADIDKNWNLHGQDADAHAKYGFWSSISDITKSINFQVNVLGNSAQLAAIHFPGFAKGGIPTMGGMLGINIPAFAEGKPAKRKSDGTSVREAGMNDLASFMQRIVSSVSVPSKGGQYSKPTFLVGEEYRPEFVIATNPAYREQNKELLKQAAASLGMEVFKRGGARNTTYGLPPKDRIAGIGTADMQATLSALQSKRAPMKAHTGPWNSLTSQIRKLTSLIAQADYYQADFQNLEDSITNVGHYMDTADRSPTDRATGFDYTGRFGRRGREVTLTWDQWHHEQEDLMAQHTARIRQALNDARNRIGRLPGAKNLHYIRALELALGQSISDETTAAATTDPLSTEQYFASIDPKVRGGGDPLAKLQYLYALAQSNNVPDDPGTAKREDIDSLQDDLVRSAQLATRYGNFFQYAQRDPSVNTNYTLLRDITDAYNQALTTYQGIQKTITDATLAIGPTQLQLHDTARANLYKTFGSNFGSISSLAAPSVVTPSLTPTNPVNLSPASAPASSTTHVNVTNHYSTQPQDPHTWSTGLAWELGAML